MLIFVKKRLISGIFRSKSHDFSKTEKGYPISPIPLFSVFSYQFILLPFQRIRRFLRSLLSTHLHLQIKEHLLLRRFQQ